MIRQLGDTSKDEKRKILGPVLTKFCAEYLKARKVYQEGAGIRIERTWQVSLYPSQDFRDDQVGSEVSKPKETSKPVVIDLTKPPRKDKVSEGIFLTWNPCEHGIRCRLQPPKPRRPSIPRCIPLIQKYWPSESRKPWEDKTSRR